MTKQTCRKCLTTFDWTRPTPFCGNCYNNLNPFAKAYYGIGGYNNYRLNKHTQKKYLTKTQLTKLKEIPKISGGFNLSGKYVIGAVVAIFIALLALNTIAVVPAGHNGIVFNWWEGVKPQPLTPGVHIIIPFAENVTMMETRTQLKEEQASAVSKDLQIVTTSVALNYRPMVESTPKLFSEIGLTYSDRLIIPAIQESVKAVTANYTAEQLIAQRPQVKQDIKDLLTIRLRRRDIIVDDISITNFKFSDMFDAAIEAKVTAEQQALEAERVLVRIKIEKEQAITQAEARAESVKLEADAEAYALQVVQQELAKSTQLIQYRAVQNWDGVLPKFTGGATPFIDVTNIVN